MGDALVFSIIACICGGIFEAIGVTAFKLDHPIHFWSGTVIKSEEITDIKAYNRANGWMWVIYGACYILAGIVAFYKMAYGGVILGVSAMPGMFVLMGTYVSIEKKYRVKKAETIEEKLRRQMKDDAFK
ncbi:hypothetical protein PBV87_18525 [Niameybacter massiliensis]|uniref:DUF3784 domain-containing protein n=1 Tax=Holtiella tumoricola TaxID=3018743 RepID=A0AA42DRK9_9FIRM|nr:MULTISPECIES: hypothetical protein [Lachnospirales]MDA3733479.1 hypothetical protein [Holtiella tumoricola]